MITHWVRLIILWMAFQVSALGETPPPLAFSDIVDDEQTYYIYDFETEDVTTLPRMARGSVPDFQSGFSTPPEEFEYRSPHDPEVRFVFVDESDRVTEIAEDGYAMYRLRENGERTLIATGADFFLNEYWSQDGQYVYLHANSIENVDASTLYQYDVYAETLVALLQGQVGLGNCDPYSGWCIASQFNEDDSRIIYALDKNSSVIQEIENHARGRNFYAWQRDAPEVYYSASLEDAPTSIHIYNYETDTLNEVAQLEIVGRGQPNRTITRQALVGDPSLERSGTQVTARGC